MKETFETKDSGKREALAGGMVRDVTAGKVDYALVLQGPLFQRWAELLSRGAIKYGKNNWTLALESDDIAARAETSERFRESAMRHFVQWMQGDRSEDHASAVVFNLNGYEAMRDTDVSALEVTNVPHEREWFEAKVPKAVYKDDGPNGCNCDDCASCRNERDNLLDEMSARGEREVAL